MYRQDWLLWVIAAASPSGLSPVQLQKMMFLLGEERPEAVGDDYYEFEPYDYGPFTSRVYSDADTLAVSGFLSIEKPLSRGWRRYCATQEGLEKCVTLADDIDPETREFIAETVAWIRKKSFPDLVRAIYERYPSYRDRSVFKDHSVS